MSNRYHNMRADQIIHELTVELDRTHQKNKNRKKALKQQRVAYERMQVRHLIGQMQINSLEGEVVDLTKRLEFANARIRDLEAAACPSA